MMAPDAGVKVRNVPPAGLGHLAESAPDDEVSGVQSEQSIMAKLKSMWE